MLARIRWRILGTKIRFQPSNNEDNISPIVLSDTTCSFSNFTPDSSTAASSVNFLLAISKTFSSTVPFVTILQINQKNMKENSESHLKSKWRSIEAYLYIVTGFVCPIRWQRSSACRSIWGLKSMSCIMTVSAPVKFKPWPPALVDSRHANIEESLLKVSTIVCLSVTWVLHRGKK